MSLAIFISLVGLILEANLRYHREAYHIQLRKLLGSPALREPAPSFPRAVAG